MNLLNKTFLVSVIMNLASLCEPIVIGAFNIKTFGASKYSEADTMDYIKKIIRRYDIVLIQEIRDSSLEVIPELLKDLKSDGGDWDMKYSDSLGRSTYKEQYAYYYRKDKLKVKSVYQYDDGADDGTDEFSREPFGVLVESSTTGALKQFGIFGVHIAPEDAIVEVNALTNVSTAGKAHWNIEDVMIMGDFNADCSYMNSNELASLELKTEDFLWLIDDDADTTVANTTDCAYDRIVVTGELLRKSVDKDSAKVYRFDEVYKLDQDAAKAISDHYPVEVVIPDDDSGNGTACHSGPRIIELLTLLLLMCSI